MDLQANDEDFWNAFFQKYISLRKLSEQEPSPFQVPLHAFPYQPWARHANPTAWFNQGLNAQTWPMQAQQQAQIRKKILEKQTLNKE